MVLVLILGLPWYCQYYWYYQYYWAYWCLACLGELVPPDYHDGRWLMRSEDNRGAAGIIYNIEPLLDVWDKNVALPTLRNVAFNVNNFRDIETSNVKWNLVKSSSWFKTYSSDRKWEVNIWGQWMLNQNVLPETLKSTTACLSKPLLLKVGKHYSLLLKPQHSWKVWWVIGRCQDTISISQTQGGMHSLALHFTNMEIKKSFKMLIWSNLYL